MKQLVTFLTVVFVCMFALTTALHAQDPVCDTNDPGVDIPDADVKGLTSTIEIDEEDSIRIGDLNVSVAIAHTWNGDLVITLTSPDDDVITLFDDVNDQGAGIDTTYDDEEAGAESS